MVALYYAHSIIMSLRIKTSADLQSFAHSENVHLRSSPEHNSVHHSEYNNAHLYNTFQEQPSVLRTSLEFLFR